ncbi:MAG: chemotaxis protein CheW [Candidatus Cloacimonetes bacterium]|nr:chemotaxis protein CheW [Candidatus Cloacimonadota bacterium]
MAKANSFLIFREGGQRFGLNLAEVERIEKCVEIEDMAAKPEYVKGILNYHGELIPVIDLRRVFQLKEREESLSDMLIIARTARRVLAIWAEAVEGIVEKSGEEIEDAQRFFLGLDYVKGIFKFADKTVLINDLDKFISDREFKKLYKVINQ